MGTNFIRKVNFTILCLSMTFLSYSQVRDLSEIKAKISKCTSDTCRIKQEYQLCLYWLRSNIDSCIVNSEKAIEKFEKKPDFNVKFMFTNLVAASYIQKRDYVKADSIYKILLEVKDSVKLINKNSLFASIGNLHFIQNELDSAAYYYNYALESLDTTSDSYIFFLAAIEGQLSSIDSKKLNYKKAIKRLEFAEKTILNEKELTPDTRNQLVSIHSRKGVLYRKSNNPEAALSEFKECIKLSENNAQSKYSAYINMANIYSDQNDFDQLAVILDTLEQNFEKLHPGSKCGFYNLESDYFRSQRMFDKAQNFNQKLLICYKNRNQDDEIFNFYINQGRIEED